MSDRKVIQLCAMSGYCVAAPAQPNSYVPSPERVVEPTLYALCGDGSIWAMDGNHDKWVSISTKSIRESAERNKSGTP